MSQTEKEPLLVLLDTEEEYTLLFSDFLKRHRDLPWTVRSYTDEKELRNSEKDRKASLLVVAESSYREDAPVMDADRTVILAERGRWCSGDLPVVDKYSPAEDVLARLLEIYMEIGGEYAGGSARTTGTRFIGLYTPVHRALQSTFALTLGQMLAEHHRVLYLSFEHYAGLRELVPETQQKDLADLMFFLLSDEQRFFLRFQTIKKSIAGLDYIPPMKSGQNLLTIPGGEWLRLMDQIRAMGTYDFVLMDLSESMQGLFDVMRKCEKIYTMSREDRISRSKLLQYEQVLELYEYDDVLRKTKRFDLPKFHRIPTDVDQYTRGDLAEYVRGTIREIRRSKEESEQEEGEGKWNMQS